MAVDWEARYAAMREEQARLRTIQIPEDTSDLRGVNVRNRWSRRGFSLIRTMEHKRRTQLRDIAYVCPNFWFSLMEATKVAYSLRRRSHG